MAAAPGSCPPVTARHQRLAGHLTETGSHTRPAPRSGSWIVTVTQWNREQQCQRATAVPCGRQMESGSHSTLTSIPSAITTNVTRNVMSKRKAARSKHTSSRDYSTSTGTNGVTSNGHTCSSYRAKVEPHAISPRAISTRHLMLPPQVSITHSRPTQLKLHTCAILTRSKLLQLTATSL